MINFKITVLLAVSALLALFGCTSKYEIKPQASELIVLESLETLENIKKRNTDRNATGTSPIVFASKSNRCKSRTSRDVNSQRL